MQLNSKNRICEIIGVSLIFIGTFFLFFKSVEENERLESEGVYVIGKLFSTSSGGENGWTYYYRFLYNNKIYQKMVPGPLSSKIKNDSVIFFKIVPSNPGISRELQDIKVPEWLRLIEYPKMGWKQIPSIP